MKGPCWKVEIRKDCKVCGSPLPTKKHRTYCSKRCANKVHNKTSYIKRDGAVWQRDYLQRRHANDGKQKIQCLLCGKWFRQVGSHVYQVHKMPARDYREMVGFDVKRGQLPDDLRQLKREHVFENKTVKNLKAGKKFWYKPGQAGCGVYRRSAQTMERLHKGTKNL